MFQKGMTKTGGRTKNQKNHVSKEIRKVTAALLQGELETLKELLPTLKPDQYLKAIAMLYKVVVPQQRQIEHDNINEPTEITVEIIDRLSQVTDNEAEQAIDTWVQDKRNK
tara:strand:+ start:100 stop:432 length:333 start_codon:yes stop_codon:yes gene_type:complete